MQMNSYVLAGGVTLLLLFVLSPLAFRVGLVDHPGERHGHQRVTPLIGGIAMYVGFVVGVLTLDIPGQEWQALLTAATLLLLVGMFDDLRELSATVRFITQIIAALIMTQWGGVVVNDLGNLLGTGPIELGVWAVPFTVFGTIGVINAFNMMDGLDGLAGGLMLLLLSALAVMTTLRGNAVDAAILITLAVPVAVFLTRNVRISRRGHAALFMGDAGSMFLGLMVAWFTVKLSQAPDNVIQPATALWLFALPLMDTTAIMLRRALKGRSPFSPDRQHFHHILLLAGFSVRRTVLIMHVLAALLLAVGVTGLYLGLPEPLLFYSFIGLFGVYFFGVMHAWRAMKVVRSMGGRQPA